MRVNIAILLVVVVGALLFSGCALFNDSVQKAQEIADKREAQAAEAFTNWEAAGLALSDLLDQLAVATDAGTIEMLKNLIVAATQKKEVAEAAYKSSIDIYKAAVSDFKDAKGASDYLGTIFGWLSVGLSALGIGGGVVQTIRVGRRNVALGGSTKMIEKLKAVDGAGPAWAKAKANLHATLPTTALRIIDAIRPGA